MDPMDEMTGVVPSSPLDTTIPNNQTIQDRTSHCADEVLQFMRAQLLALRPPELFLFSRQIAFGLYILLRANAANVHASEHWEMFFVLMEAVGAAAYQEEDGADMAEINHHMAQTKTHRVHGKRSGSQNPHHHHHNKLGAVQSDPEDGAQQQKTGGATGVARAEDRGYCSDDPQLGGGRRTENPLLQMNPTGGGLKLMNKADSGEWIHVVPVSHQLVTAPNTQHPSAFPVSVPTPVQATQPPPSSHQPVSEISSSAIPQVQAVGLATQSPAKMIPDSSTTLPPQPHQVQAVLEQQPPSLSHPPPKSSTGQQQLSSLPAVLATQPDQSAPPPPPPPPPPHPRAGVFKRGTVVLAPSLGRHDPAAFLKVCEILAFLARDAAHITPANFTQFTRCLRIMVEASLDGGRCAPVQLPSSSFPNNTHAAKQFPMPSEHVEKDHQHQQQHQNSQKATVEEEKVSEQERLANCYMDASLQLLNICAQLHARAANIHSEWNSSATSAEEGAVHPQNSPSNELWTAYWRPLLQAMARMSCDCRRRIRAQALDALATSFRVPALGEQMRPTDWEDCFAEVLFPLLNRLLSSTPPISPMDPIGMEEARIRAIQFICKILLGHLTLISRLDTFPDLLRRLFDLTDQFLEGNACSDLLAEVIQESLKNCVLVCENFGVFREARAGLHGELQQKLEGMAKKHGIGGGPGAGGQISRMG